MSSSQKPRDTKPRVVLDPYSTRPQRPLPVKDLRQTKEYKAAARRWVSTIVALPILMYTSYVLYERTYGNQQPRRLVKRPNAADDSETK
ncbi:hypothetical protein BJX61DRAFT_126053 [Aspergillus egyptiacus]|nr:hypothetical protein BJX61DRAFT_126053 [Aspergillus egyptiacus]